MNRPIFYFFIASFAVLLSLAPTSMAQGTYNAASCNYSDVNAVINGPTHTAVNGDVIKIPAGTCTWTTTLSVTKAITITGSGTPNTGANTFGAGTPTTVIVQNTISYEPLISVTGITYGQTVTLSLLDIEPYSASTALQSPIQVAGTCNSNGCPQTRIDNIGFGLKTPWTENGNSSGAAWMIRTDNVFGVLDHNTLPNGSAVLLFTSNLSSYQGIGTWGDNSWAQPDSFGGANVLYIENNIIYAFEAVNDCETAPAGGAVGGCRIAGRFNEIYAEPGFYGAFEVHGLDTDGRPQSGRQIEAYGNTINCTISASCGAVDSYRGGTGYVFGNTLNASGGGSYASITNISVYRSVYTAPDGWGACGGSGPFDTNDGTVYYSGTMGSGSSGLTMNDSTKSWTTNQFIPTGAPYSVYDVTKGFWAEIASNTATSITMQGGIPEQSNSFAVGDSYQILRATVCADQAGRGAGRYVSGNPPAASAALTQALDPIYEWDDTAQNLSKGNMTTDTLRTIANRDWYTDGSNGTPHVQTSPASPFNGTSGVGFGTLANRPTSCTTSGGGWGPGYFATDQGNWNQSGNDFGQGELFVCSATNTWTAVYTPYTYPHPLVSGGTVTGGDPPNPPSGLTAIVQ